MDQWSVKTRLSSSYKLVVGNSIPSPEQFPFSSFFWQKGIMVRKQIHSLVTTVKCLTWTQNRCCPNGSCEHWVWIPYLFLIVTSSARLSHLRSCDLSSWRHPRLSKRPAHLFFLSLEIFSIYERAHHLPLLSEGRGFPKEFSVLLLHLLTLTLPWPHTSMASRVPTLPQRLLFRPPLSH